MNSAYLFTDKHHVVCWRVSAGKIAPSIYIVMYNTIITCTSPQVLHLQKLCYYKVLLEYY